MDADTLREIHNKLILHWNYRDLREIPEELRDNGDHIQEIYLKWNNIERLPRWLGKLKNLTNLYLYGNQLYTLPNEIDELQSLLCLDVGQNHLAYLPSAIGRMSQLSVLCAARNYLTCLPDEISELTSLKILHLPGNMISNLPESICKCRDLEEICLDKNNLTNLPQQIVYLPNLDFLSVSQNKILYLPALPFISSPLLHFEGNPGINYLTFCLGSQISLNFGHNNNNMWSIETFGCFESNVTSIEVLQNVKLHITRPFYHGMDYVQLVMPQGLLTVCQPVQRCKSIPSMYELSLRKVYQNLYRHKLNIIHSSGHDMISMTYEPTYQNISEISLFPRNIELQLLKGPTTICINPHCNTPIFSYAIVWVIPKSTVNRYGDIKEILSTMFFCSDHCSSNCTAYEELKPSIINGCY